jgi:hypothetical protein
MLIQKNFRSKRVETPLFLMFHTSCVHLQLPAHPLYPNIDWNKVGGGHYAVVDPMDDNGILYLSDKEYKVQVRVSVSQDSQLSVLARPGDTPEQTKPAPDKSSNAPSKTQNSPSLEEKFGAVVVRKHNPLVVHYPARKLGSLPFSGWYISRLEKWRTGELLVTPTNENLLTLVLYWGLDLNIRAGGQLEPQPALNSALIELGKSLARILTTRGSTALILKMKNTLFFVNRWLGGVQNDDPFLLGEPVGLARSGLPRILPLYLRRALGSKNERLIRLVQSLLKSYSAFEGSHKDVDLVSVTGSCPEINKETLESFERFSREIFWPIVIRKYAKEANMGFILKPDFRPKPRDPPFYPTRGGPNCQVGILGAPLDAIAWAACPRPYPRMWFEHVQDSRSVHLFDRVLSRTEASRRLALDLGKNYDTNVAILKGWDFKRDLDVGKLAFLPEPAGKVRTIAIVDYWTQRAMKPVHDWMMSVLSVLPTDGTFNQEESLRSYVAETQTASRHYSIDLKSATDMIPIEAYKAVLLGIWPKETVELWMALLTERWFRVPKGTKQFVPLVRANLRGTLVEYNRGQPMGTLSSWASMALVHHALELFAAWRVGVDPVSFTAYRVLGDDNVTGNCEVAASYLSVCRELQIPISHSKTLEGKLFVFASQVYLDGKNISPMSLKEELQVKTCSQRVEMALRAVSRGWIGDKPTTARLLRLLCRKRDYLRSVKEFANGKLGRVAQAALVSAFGLATKVLPRLGFQESRFIPFLLSLENKVQVLAGDKSQLSRRNQKYFDEAEILLAIAMLRNLIAMLRKDLADARNTCVRWSNWGARMHRGPYVPQHLEGVALSMTELSDPSYGQWVTLPRPSEWKVPLALWQSWSLAIWPVLQDYYDAWFYDPKEDPKLIELLHRKLQSSKNIPSRSRRGRRPDAPAWNSAKSLEELEAQEPKIISKIQECLNLAELCLKRLLIDDSDGPDGPFQGSMELVTAVVEMKSSLPRLPTFETVDSLIPDRSPKEVDNAKAWVRQMKTFTSLLNHLDLYTDFSVLDFPDDVGIDEYGEALRVTSPEVTASQRRKGATPSAEG